MYGCADLIHSSDAVFVVYSYFRICGPSPTTEVSRLTKKKKVDAGGVIPYEFLTCSHIPDITNLYVIGAW